MSKEINRERDCMRDLLWIGPAILLFHYLLVLMTNDFYVPPDYQLERSIEAPVHALMDDRHYVIILWKTEEQIRRGGKFWERRSGKNYEKWRIANREVVPQELIGKYLSSKKLKLKYKIVKEGKIPVIMVTEFKLK